MSLMIRDEIETGPGNAAQGQALEVFDLVT